MVSDGSMSPLLQESENANLTMPAHLKARGTTVIFKCSNQYLAHTGRRPIEDALLLRRRQSAVQRQQPQAAAGELCQPLRLLQRPDLRVKISMTTSATMWGQLVFKDAPDASCCVASGQAFVKPALGRAGHRVCNEDSSLAA